MSAAKSTVRRRKRTHEREGATPVTPDSFQVERRIHSASIARKRIMLVDDHPMTRAGMAQLINKQPNLTVCCEVRDASEAFREIAKQIPDLILTDITMPGRDGIEFIKDLRALQPTVPILVVSMHDELIYGERALRAGAHGYIMKEAGGEKLLAAITCVLAGEIYLSPQMTASAVSALAGIRPRNSTSPIQCLSDREFEIFQLIGQGRNTHVIAEYLNVSPKTVDVHRSHIKEKLKLDDTTALLRHAVRWVESQGV